MLTPYIALNSWSSTLRRAIPPRHSQVRILFQWQTFTVRSIDNVADKRPIVTSNLVEWITLTFIFIARRYDNHSQMLCYSCSRLCIDIIQFLMASMCAIAHSNNKMWRIFILRCCFGNAKWLSTHHHDSKTSTYVWVQWVFKFLMKNRCRRVFFLFIHWISTTMSERERFTFLLLCLSHFIVSDRFRLWWSEFSLLTEYNAMEWNGQVDWITQRVLEDFVIVAEGDLWNGKFSKAQLR